MKPQLGMEIKHIWNHHPDDDIESNIKTDHSGQFKLNTNDSMIL